MSACATDSGGIRTAIRGVTPCDRRYVSIITIVYVRVPLAMALSVRADSSGLGGVAIRVRQLLAFGKHTLRLRPPLPMARRLRRPPSLAYPLGALRGSLAVGP